MRATPLRRTVPPVAASDAAIAGTRVRMVRPELPTNRSISGPPGRAENRPSTPCTTKAPASASSIATPSLTSESRMTAVSSEASRSRTSVRPCAKAANSKTRLEMLLLPGKATVPRAFAARGRSR